MKKIFSLFTHGFGCILKRPLLLFYIITGFFLIVVLSFIGRFWKKTKIGVGPEPLINNVYHVKALRKAGYDAESFVTHTYFITDNFDIRFDKVPKVFRTIVAYGYVVLNYSCIYFYFNGGPLMNTPFKRLEPFFLRLALVRTVVMPYGSDVGDMSRTSNLLYRNATAKDYPKYYKCTRKRTIGQIDLWIKCADHIISGCDWVEYLYHWDSLMLGHFSIDLETVKPLFNKVFPSRFSAERPLRLLHAPNHRNIKGTKYFEKAVERLQKEGCSIELKIVQKVPNSVVRTEIEDADVILDQLIIGWYAMFSIEAMALRRPVICNLDDRFRRLYEAEGLIESDEIPIINASIDTVYDQLKAIYNGNIDLETAASRGRLFVERHHSLEYVGSVFKEINETLGIFPVGKQFSTK